jgi:hypothetical protein
MKPSSKLCLSTPGAPFASGFQTTVLYMLSRYQGYAINWYALSRDGFNYYPDNDAGMWLPSRCLAMDTRSDSDIPAFMRYATIFSTCPMYAVNCAHLIFLDLITLLIFGTYIEFYKVIGDCIYFNQYEFCIDLIYVNYLLHISAFRPSSVMQHTIYRYIGTQYVKVVGYRYVC